jgi:D-alanyl-D-alanine carboxypeptidase (penicillin-binding protein 5/6)
MASTTKIATAITVIENCTNLDEEFVIDDRAVGVEGSSIYLKKGERQTVRNLLYGLMLQSGNDCAVALALKVGGSVENFANMMNKIALKVGAGNTNFTNPHGLHDDDHYTTAYDLALISAYAMKNSIFRDIVSTKQMRIVSDDRERILVNKNKILSTLEGGDGVKTGYTKKAGRCLVSSATRNGMNVICVVLNCYDMFDRSRSLIEDAFARYELLEILPIGEVTSTSVKGGKSKEVAVGCLKSFSYPLKKDEIKRVEIRIEGVESMVAPVKKLTKNGKIQIFLDKQLIFSDNLFTIYNVESKNLWDKLKDLLQN